MQQQLTICLVLASLILCSFGELQLYHPLLHGNTLTVHEPTLAKVGELVEHVPTAVSHQSSTIVHSSAPRLTPLLTPAVRSYAATALPISAAAAYVHAHTGALARTYPAWSYRSAPWLYSAHYFKK